MNIKPLADRVFMGHQLWLNGVPMLRKGMPRVKLIWTRFLHSWIALGPWTLPWMPTRFREDGSRGRFSWLLLFCPFASMRSALLACRRRGERFLILVTILIDYSGLTRVTGCSHTGWRRLRILWYRQVEHALPFSQPFYYRWFAWDCCYLQRAWYQDLSHRQYCHLR